VSALWLRAFPRHPIRQTDGSLNDLHTDAA
jgi:hypothetical protein